jgi:hypothetical protein
MAERLCVLAGCVTPAWARGWCHTHYERWRRHGTTKPRKPTLRERLLAGLVIDPSGCLLWTGRIDRNGYGRIDAPTPRLVHILMWEMFEGPVPDGLELDHVKARGCVNRHCASIAHLEPVTHRENVLRGDTIVARNAAKTECDNGHPFDLFNTYYDRGRRGCLTCRRARDRNRGRRRPQAASGYRVAPLPPQPAKKPDKETDA